ncbi:hypothetical protein FRC05_005297 [Tulasnella sp. 425]|nr:hypothetical protein FRC05_005297 [Tulasnella sp. 425]
MLGSIRSTWIRKMYVASLRLTRLRKGGFIPNPSVQEISQEVGIRAMPTFIAFKDGQKLGELVGANPSGLQQLLQTHAA